jgi:hypothetical protein
MTWKRVDQLKEKLAAREGLKGFEENVEAIKKELRRLGRACP